MSVVIESSPVPLKADADGVLRVGGTRVTLDTVVHAFNAGATPEQIAQDYPSLELADVYAVISFYLQHVSEVDQYLREQQREAAEVRREMESRFSPAGIRQRLMARRSGKGEDRAATAGG
ncbi:MAG: DUF433 domain-containing protein [Planctomycetes bacterium]|nr:DUF433 domain-containing protein [Planctomycetota bacterium]